MQRLTKTPSSYPSARRPLDDDGPDEVGQAQRLRQRRFVERGADETLGLRQVGAGDGEIEAGVEAMGRRGALQD